MAGVYDSNKNIKVIKAFRNDKKYLEYVKADSLRRQTLENENREALQHIREVVKKRHNM